MVTFVRYALIVVGAFDGATTKLGTCDKQQLYMYIYSFICFVACQSTLEKYPR